MATIIQCAFRKHKARMLFKCLVVEIEIEMIEFTMATKSRKHVFNFYKQQKCLQDISEANSKMRRELDEYYVRTNEEQEQARYERGKKKHFIRIRKDGKI